MKVKIGDISLYMDGYLHKNLTALQNIVRKDWDCIGLYVGYEGDGKTVKAMQDALFFDKDFNIDKVVFTPEQFSEAVDNAPKYSVVLWDEADEVVAANWANKTTIAITRKLKRIRSKNLFILLVTPTFFDLGKYFATHRTRYMIHIYSEGTQRGYLRFFNREKKKLLYLKGKKEWDLNCVRPNFLGRFTKLPDNFPIDWKEYQAKKDEATVGLEDNNHHDDGVRLKIQEFRGQSLVRLERLIFQKFNKKLTNFELAHIFDVDRSTITKDKANWGLSVGNYSTNLQVKRGGK